MGELHNRRSLKEVRASLRSNGTASEAVLWLALQKAKLKGRKFRRQHSVGPFVLDFYCPSERLCIEVDGGVHETPTASMNDQMRDVYLGTFKIRVLRFTNKEILDNVEGVLERITESFGRRYGSI